MRLLEEVRSEVLASVPRLDHEKIHFTNAVGRVLAEPVEAAEDVPAFANSAMDGYAVRHEDATEPGAVLEVVGEVPAGRASRLPVEAGQTIKIMTGAPIPEGADAVVPVEETTVEEGKVRLEAAVAPGAHVRPAGEDVKAGQTVFEAGIRLTPMHIGVLATIGAVEPVVSRRPLVALMSTGDELEPAEAPSLAPGMIRDSNRPMLDSLLEDAGAIVIDLGQISDDPDELRAAIQRGAAEADAIVTSGGVSMGEYDVTKLVLGDDAGVRFMRVAIKPAKPFAFGHVEGVPFFGLPGNPVSVLVSFEQFVRPALLTMQGARAVLRPRVMGVAGEKLATDPAKTTFVRVRVVGDTPEMRVVQSGAQGSNVLSAAANADAFAVVPVGVGVVDEGDQVLLELFRSPEVREAG